MARRPIAGQSWFKGDRQEQASTGEPRADALRLANIARQPSHPSLVPIVPTNLPEVQCLIRLFRQIVAIGSITQMRQLQPIGRSEQSGNTRHTFEFEQTCLAIGIAGVVLHAATVLTVATVLTGSTS